MPYRHLYIVGLLSLLSDLTTLEASPDAQSFDSIIQVEWTSPVERQVIQRDSQNRAVLNLKGVIRTSIQMPATLRCLISSNDPQGRLTPILRHERRFTFESGENPFSLAVNVPAGGWYQVALSVRTNDRTIKRMVRQKVGIGEIFLTAGQSNAANSGAVAACPKDDRVSSYDWNQGVWLKACDPQPGASGQGGSLWPILGDLLVEKLDMPVAFVSVAWGGTDVSWWSPGHPGYDRLRQVVGQSGLHRLRAILWIQGEADALYGFYGTMAMRRELFSAYHDTLKKTILQLNHDAGYAVPWFVANVSLISMLPGHPAPGIHNYPGGREAMDIVRKAQRALWYEGIALPGPDIDALRGEDFRLEDRTHLNQAGLQRHALLWLKTLEKQVWFRPAASKREKGLK